MVEAAGVELHRPADNEQLTDFYGIPKPYKRTIEPSLVRKQYSPLSRAAPYV